MVILPLFHTKRIFDDQNVAVIVKHPETGQIRISKTAKLIEQAKRITYLVTGEAKADILKKFRPHFRKNCLTLRLKFRRKMG